MRSALAALFLLSLVTFCAAIPLKKDNGLPVQHESNPICDECEKIVTSLLGAAKSANATYQSTLKKQLDEQICDKLPAEYTDPCKTAVDVDVPALWEEIIKELMNPLATCQNLMLCEDRARLEAESDFACDVCMKAAKYLDEKVFESAKVDAKVAEKLKKVCQDIPDMKPAELKKCELLVETDTPLIMEEIGKALSEQLCTDAGVCTSA